MLPWVNIFLSAPLTALVPVLMVLFGFGMKSIIITTTLFAIWIIILNSRAGVMQINRSLIEMARSFGASPMDAFFKIYVWAALPEILGGVRIGIIRAVKGVIIGQLLISIVGFRRPVRALLGQLPDGAFLGSADRAVCDGLHDLGNLRLPRTPRVLLRCETLTHAEFPANTHDR